MFHLKINIMKINSGRLQVLPLLLVAALLLHTAVMAQGSKTNFSGSWTYNAAKSNTGQQRGQAAGQDQRAGGQNRGGFGGGNFTVKQEGNLLTVERTMTTSDGSTRTTSSKYTLDGKETVNSSRMGESKSFATWSADGRKLTIETIRTFERDGESRTMKTTEVWSLTDSKTLQIETTMPSPNGERKMTSVYDKK
jgi:hypothetical protein